VVVEIEKKVQIRDIIFSKYQQAYWLDGRVGMGRRRHPRHHGFLAVPQTELGGS
jgi:hypothetical protein